MITKEKAEAEYQRLIKDSLPGFFCHSGHIYCNGKRTLEDAWNKCTKGRFLYTWLKWVCDVWPSEFAAVDVHFSHHDMRRGTAAKIKANFTYWGKRIS